MDPEVDAAAEHPSVARFRAELARRGGAGEIVVLPESVHTAALAAQALGCEVGAIANSLLFEVRADEAGSARPVDAPDGSAGSEGSSTPLLVLTSGAHRVDTAKVAGTLGVPALHRATPDFVRRHTGQVIGGVSPFAHPVPVRTLIDPWLRRHPVVWAAAGHPAAVFSTTTEELLRMIGAEEIDVA